MRTLIGFKQVVFAAVAAMGVTAFGEVTPTVLPIETKPWLPIDASNASTLETVTNPDTGVVTLESAKDASGGSRQ